ncbi:hypothetical protein CYMTET_25509 [Cymbomonas tetramitiformis]|uniref:Uncharacterized protein n=1 Tax=Cymbomonas tetramitiformis TaxID=36881 RepID=A0AAE0FTL4_9CHLO|nr:hypothetical protein CYMTET_25509 [Cymbomonas tetramitiformis]
MGRALGGRVRDPGTRGSSDAFLLQLAGDGRVVRTLQVGGDELDLARGVAIDPADPSTVYVTGSFRSTATFGASGQIEPPVLTGPPMSQNVFVMKVLPNWDVEFAVQAGGDGTDKGYSIAVAHQEAAPYGPTVYVAGLMHSGTLGGSIPATFSRFRLHHFHTNRTYDAFLMKLLPAIVPPPPPPPPPAVPAPPPSPAPPPASPFSPPPSLLCLEPTISTSRGAALLPVD